MGELVIFLLDYVLLNYRQEMREKQLKPGVWIVRRNLSLLILSGLKDHGSFLLSVGINSEKLCRTASHVLTFLWANTTEYGNGSIPSLSLFSPQLNSYAMGKLLAQHLQDIITVLCSSLSWKVRSWRLLKADIFPFRDLEIFMNLLTQELPWFSLVVI